MQNPPIPVDEEPRLEALHSLCILDTPPEERFDRVTRLARAVLNVPISLISLVDRDRQWFKSRQGLDVSETPRAISFCAHAILGEGALVVGNAQLDPRFADNPLVTGTPFIRFYAGLPLRTHDGRSLGTLCVIDRVPRELGAQELALLEDLGHIVESEFRILRISELQREVEQAQDGLRKFFSLSLDLLCIANTDGYFEKLNPAWTEVLGYPLEELYGRPFLEFVHPDDRPATLREVERLAGGLVTVEFENRYRCKSGGYRILNWSAVADPATGRLFAAARDITHLRRAERDLRTARRQAESASRAKSQFLANMSHEFRTPLNSVIGFTNVMLEEDHGLSDLHRTYLERIRANGRDLLELVNDILDVSKIEAGKIELDYAMVSLADLIGQVVGKLEVQARNKKLELRLDVPDGLPAIRTDPQRLTQVLTNLIGNAVKFTSAGSVSVAVRPDARGAPRRIEVADSGVGIPAHHREQIFQAFEQGDKGRDRQQPGTGLGLTIAKSLCDLLGYRIDLRSKVGEGSTFTIDLAPARRR